MSGLSATLKRRPLLTAIGGVLVVALVAWCAYALVQHVRYGSTYDEHHRTVSVGKGDRFTLAVPDRGGSVGDHWTAAVTPQDGATLIRQRKVLTLPERILGSHNAGGGQGTSYFTFAAAHRGTVTVALHNCFQGCDRPWTEADSRTVGWTVTIS